MDENRSSSLHRFAWIEKMAGDGRIVRGCSDRGDGPQFLREAVARYKKDPGFKRYRKMKESP
jgi:hypothetical protein